MSKDPIQVAIGNAWKAHRAGDQDSAIRQYNEILEKDPESIDGLYGLGLAQKSMGDVLGAKLTFTKLQTILDRLVSQEESSNLTMQLRMVKQQLDMLGK